MLSNRIVCAKFDDFFFVRTLALASLAASASAAIALCSCTGRRTSLLEEGILGQRKEYEDDEVGLHLDPLHLDAPGIRGLVEPGLVVGGGPATCIVKAILSRSERISARLLVPDQEHWGARREGT